MKTEKKILVVIITILIKNYDDKFNSTFCQKFSLIFDYTYKIVFLIHARVKMAIASIFVC